MFAKQMGECGPVSWTTERFHWHDCVMAFAHVSLLLPNCGLDCLNPLNSRVQSQSVISHLVMISVPPEQGCYTSLCHSILITSLPVPYLHPSLTQKPLTHCVPSLPRLAGLGAITCKKPFVGCFAWFSFTQARLVLNSLCGQEWFICLFKYTSMVVIWKCQPTNCWWQIFLLPVVKWDWWGGCIGFFLINK